MKSTVKKVAVVGFLTSLVMSCSYERSSVTGWDYTNPMNGCFDKKPYEEQEKGPGSILIEVVPFTMWQI